MSESRPGSPRRLVLHLGGYDLAEPVEQHRRFVRELARYATTWGIRAEATALQTAPDALLAEWEIVTHGPNWRQETRYRVLRWDDIVARDLARHPLRRLGRALLSFGDFVLTGTAWRYVRLRWPFAMFFAFPYAWLAVFAATGLAVSWSVGGGLIGWGLAVAVFTALYAGPGRWLRVPQALEHWDFQRTYMRQKRPETTARMQAFAEGLVAEVARGEFTEIVLVGHSVGSTLALEVLNRALAIDPLLAARGPALGLLTVGAIIPTLALHPKGSQVQRQAERLAVATGLTWAEYQASDDPISFYKVDPRTMRRQRDYPPGSRPMVRRVHVHEMLTPAVYRRFRHRHVRLHYQFLMANDRPARYDFFMIACGPVPFAELTAEHGGPLAWLAVDARRLERPTAEDRFSPAYRAIHH